MRHVDVPRGQVNDGSTLNQDTERQAVVIHTSLSRGGCWQRENRFWFGSKLSSAVRPSDTEWLAVNEEETFPASLRQYECD